MRGTWRPRARSTLAALLLGLGPAAMVGAQEMPVPVDVQYSLFLKALLFDRPFKPRAQDAVVLGIAYQSTFRPSLAAMEAMVQAIADAPGRSVLGLPLHHVLVDLGGRPQVAEDALPLQHLDLLYVAPLRAFDLAGLAQACSGAGVTTLTGVPEYCNSGVVLGIGSRGGKPTLVVNLKAARAAGAGFSARLLTLATIIQ